MGWSTTMLNENEFVELFENLSCSTPAEAREFLSLIERVPPRAASMSARHLHLLKVGLCILRARACLP